MSENFGGPPGVNLEFVFDRPYYALHHEPYPRHGLPPPPPPPGMYPPGPPPPPVMRGHSKKKNGKRIIPKSRPGQWPGPPPPPGYAPPPMPYYLTESSSEDDDDDEKPEEVDDTLKSEVKPLFAAGGECRCVTCVDWEDDAPSWVDREEKKARRIKRMRGSYAVVHRQARYNLADGWQTHTIEVNSDKLRSLLVEVTSPNLPGISGPPPTFSHMTLCPPFSTLFHRQDAYVALMEKEESNEVKKEAELLHGILMDNWNPAFAALKACEDSGVISYRFFWTIMPPDTLVVIRLRGYVAVGKLEKIYVARHDKDECWKVIVKVVEWNGSYTGYARKAFWIQEFSGEQNVTDLSVYPLRFHANPEGLKSALIARGRKFEALRGYHYKAFDPENHEFADPAGRERVIIDTFAYYKFDEETKRPSLIPLASSGLSDTDDDGLSIISAEEVFDDSDEEEGRARGAIAIPARERSTSRGSSHSKSRHRSRSSSRKDKILEPVSYERNENLESMMDGQCLLAVPTVKGFAVRSKKWYEYDITCIYDISWNEKAFNQLVMDESQKRLILAFTQNHQNDLDTRFDDFIYGKGRGMTFLLCGPPGVGKTLTAESVAEQIKAPLYILSATEVGSTASGLESGLQAALDRCAMWKAVLLIDEADVFMEERRVDNIERNSLVSVFLRLLEYYQGIMFLTTNRARALDKAFESRIDLILPYHDLDRDARRDIWSAFLERMTAASHTIGKADLDGLASVQLNGREIKNSIKTALVLARNEGGVLTSEHVQTVLALRQKAAKVLGEQ